ncbi:transmembrane protein 70, mitochondrial isoform X3 [Takifugu flavidus]|uniref:transmembrane protein 70, mitochondrial isoform X3 n=1 Tax=Takifugu flavidus TaxID=433684 RepID=UPI00254483B2|nr:transmembrane protein 70, mitochondrial isoform X3 [Takifugu flavidus]XP_056913552.1 transmembrane protein 70, mitochondrial isoform X3 [Takifugu flavidus]
MTLSQNTGPPGVKLFSYSTSGFSLLIMPKILLETGLGVQSFAMQAIFCGVVGFFTLITPAILHYFTKGYVIRLYHDADRDTYTAVTYSVFLTEKRNRFHQRQVTIPAVSKMFTSFYADKMGLLVNPDLFLIPHDYNHLMGYDKPFTFEIDDKNTAEKS